MTHGTGDSEKGASGLRLDDQLCFSLHHAARAISRVYAETLGDVHLTYPQYLVLMCLLEEDGLSIGSLGRRLGLDSGTLTPLVKRMEADGAVARRRSETDERRVQVWLTPAGRAKEDAMLQARRNVVARLGMSEGDIRALRSELMRIAGRLSASPDRRG